MIGDLIGEWIKGILIDGIMGNLSGLFNTCLLYTSGQTFFYLKTLLAQRLAKTPGRLEFLISRLGKFPQFIRNSVQHFPFLVNNFEKIQIHCMPPYISAGVLLYRSGLFAGLHGRFLHLPRLLPAKQTDNVDVYKRQAHTVCTPP